MPATVDEVIDDLIDYADFESVGSVSRAQTFVTAAKRFLILSPQQQSDQGSSLTMSVAQIEKMMHRAQQFIDQKSTVTSAASSRVRFLSASEGFRR